MKAVAQAEAQTRHVPRREGDAVVRSYMGSIMEMQPGPQAFVVSLPSPKARFGAHFHDVDQFQIVVAGQGRIGGESWTTGAVHYADAFTPYGPIVGDERGGLSYMTLRIATAGGLFEMPQSRELLKGARGRNVHAHFDGQQGLPVSGEAKVEVLLALQPDGVSATGLRLGAGAQLPALAANPAGQYLLVFKGTLKTPERELGPMSVVFLEPGEPAAQSVAGDAGCALLALTFAAPSARRGSDPSQLEGRDKYVYPEGH